MCQCYTVSEEAVCYFSYHTVACQVLLAHESSCPRFSQSFHQQCQCTKHLEDKHELQMRKRKHVSIYIKIYLSIFIFFNYFWPAVTQCLNWVKGEALTKLLCKHWPPMLARDSGPISRSSNSRSACLSLMLGS